MNLFKLEKNELTDKLRYLFVKNQSENWKRKYTAMCIAKGIKPIEQGTLSDYDFYIKIHPFVEDSDTIQHYYLIDNDEPVTYITLTKDSTDIVDITFTTSAIHQGKGYATKSVELLEQLLLSNPSIRGIKLLDQFSTGGATTKIASKLGFEQSEQDSMCFFKYNLNYQKASTDEESLYKK